MKKSLLGIIIVHALTVSTVFPASLARFARVGSRVVPADLMKAMAQRGMAADANQLKPVSDTQELDSKKEKKYKCEYCLTTFCCPAFQNAKRVGLQQPAGPIQRAEVIPALKSGSAALALGLLGGDLYYSHNLMAMSTTALLGASVFAARAGSVLKNANAGWWAADTHRRIIKYRRDCWIDLIVDASNLVALKLKERKNPMSTTKIGQGEACCRHQERSVAPMKQELKEQQ